ncbi:hypothetical protein [Propionibacterium australiense]|uniref:hypothetical protein n=1 Tax=Propionibacterium australiense TaxID=119981 RepID=UPI0011C3D68D|nr:hypothetical protein [Propionibacterium australiense]
MTAYFSLSLSLSLSGGVGGSWENLGGVGGSWENLGGVGGSWENLGGVGGRHVKTLVNSRFIGGHAALSVLVLDLLVLAPRRALPAEAVPDLVKDHRAVLGHLDEELVDGLVAPVGELADRAPGKREALDRLRRQPPLPPLIREAPERLPEPLGGQAHGVD